MACVLCETRPATGHCGHCGGPGYCDAACQRLDWLKGHRDECGTTMKTFFAGKTKRGEESGESDEESEEDEEEEATKRRRILIETLARPAAVMAVVDEPTTVSADLIDDMLLQILRMMDISDPVALFREMMALRTVSKKLEPLIYRAMFELELLQQVFTTIPRSFKYPLSFVGDFVEKLYAKVASFINLFIEKGISVMLTKPGSLRFVRPFYPALVMYDGTRVVAVWTLNVVTETLWNLRCMWEAIKSKDGCVMANIESRIYRAMEEYKDTQHVDNLRSVLRKYFFELILHERSASFAMYALTRSIDADDDGTIQVSIRPSDGVSRDSSMLPPAIKNMVEQFGYLNTLEYCSLSHYPHNSL